MQTSERYKTGMKREEKIRKKKKKERKRKKKGVSNQKISEKTNAKV